MHKNILNNITIWNYLKTAEEKSACEYLNQAP